MSTPANLNDPLELDGFNPPPSDPPAQDVAVDPAAERAAFTDLLTLLAEPGDENTVVEMLTAEQFAEVAFTPPPNETME